MKHFFLLLFTTLFLSHCTTQEESVLIKDSQPPKIVVAYVNAWEDNWGEGFEKANQITHINYAFANIKGGIVIEGYSSDAETLIKLNELKNVNKNLKILIHVY